MNPELRAKLEDRRFHCVFIHNALTAVDAGLCSYEEALAAATLALSKANEATRNIALRALNSSVHPIVAPLGDQ